MSRIHINNNAVSTYLLLLILMSTVGAFQHGVAITARMTGRTIAAFSQGPAVRSHRTRSSPTTSTSLNAFDMIPNVNILTKIDTFYQTAPYTAAFVTCGIKASAADLLAQVRSFNAIDSDSHDTNDQQLKKEEEQQMISFQQKLSSLLSSLSTSRGKSESSSIESSSSLENTNNNTVEIQRNLAFILYGGLYQGMAQEYIYNFLFPVWFGTGNDIATVLTKVAFDLIVVSPLVCIPIAYLVKATIYGQHWKEGLEKYVYDLRYKNLLLTYYSIWFPAGLCSFGLIPDHLRIAFIAFVSFFWLIILSTVSSSEKEGHSETSSLTEN